MSTSGTVAAVPDQHDIEIPKTGDILAAIEEPMKSKVEGFIESLADDMAKFVNAYAIDPWPYTTEPPKHHNCGSILGTDPYHMDFSETAWKVKHEYAIGGAVSNPNAHFKPGTSITYEPLKKLEPQVFDPGTLFGDD